MQFTAFCNRYPFAYVGWKGCLTKTMRIMHWTAVFILGCSLHLAARGISQTVTFSADRVPLQTIFSAIKKQTGFMVLWKSKVMSDAKPVSIDANQVPLQEFLYRVLNDQPLDFVFKGNTIIIYKKTPLHPSLEEMIRSGKAGQPPVTGVVRSADGQPLSGATIRVKGKNKTSATNNKGAFEIDAEEGSILIISYVGFEEMEFKVANRDAVAIILHQTLNNMDTAEVIVNTGYQSIPKERSAGSFASVKGEQIQAKSNSMNIVDRLEGLVPGLSVNYGQGNDKFLVRGATTVNLDRNPLFVVDGVPIYSYSTIESLINPNDVEGVTLLKDATAASIWGAQAANGVIVITSKKGKQKQAKPAVRYDGFVSFRGLPDNDYLKMMNTSKYVETSKELFATEGYTDAFPFSIVTNPASNGDLPVVYPHELIQYKLLDGSISAQEAGRQLDSLASLNNRDQIEKELLQPAFLTNHSISMDGGSQYHSYYGSASYTNEKFNDQSEKDRYQLNLRQDFQFTPNIRFDITTNISYEATKPFLLSDLPSDLNAYVPYALFKDADGNHLSQAYLKTYGPFRENAGLKSGINLDYVPLDEPGKTKSKNNMLSTRINAGLSIKLLKGLVFEGRAQFQRSAGESYSFYDQNSYKVRLENTYFTEPAATPDGSPIHHIPITGGHFNTTNINWTTWTIRNQLSYDNNFGNDHQITVLAGTEVRNHFNRTVNTFRRGYDFQTETYFLYDEASLSTTGVENAVLSQSTPPNRLYGNPYSAQEDETRFFSMYSNLAYDYKGRYNLNGSVRMDQSNLFGTSKSVQYKPIWSAGVSWLISREAFFYSAFINNLTVRATYGLAGNSPRPGTGGPYEILLANTNSLYAAEGTGYLVVTPANKDLVWERTKIKNLGIDFSIFKNRVHGSVDFYEKNTTDLLGDRPINPTSGWYAAYGNLGNLYNKGIEISINATHIKSRQFSWATNLNVSYNKNKVTLLKSEIFDATAGSRIYGGFVEGYSGYSLFSYKYAGLSNNGNPQVYSQKGEVIGNANDLEVDDVIYKGTTQPLWYGGITNILTYKNLTLSFLVVYNLGNQMRRDVNMFYSGRLSANIPDYFDQRWKQPGDETFAVVPRYIPNTTQSDAERTTDFYSSSDINIVSASYLRLRDVSLRYEFRKKALGILRLDRLSVYAQVNNVLLWANNKYDIDPEFYNLSEGTRTNRTKPFITFGTNIGF